MFCPKCGSILMPKKDKNRKVLHCQSCGYTDKNVKNMATIKESSKKKARKVEVVSEEAEKIYPKTEAECEKCGNTEAYFWTVQTRAGDEPETKFLKCTKCKHIWRDYN